MNQSLLFKLTIIFVVLIAIITFFKTTEPFVNFDKDPISPEQFKLNVNNLLSSLRKYMIKQKNRIQPTDSDYLSNSAYKDLDKNFNTLYKTYKSAVTSDVQKFVIQQTDNLFNIVLIPALNTSIQNNDLPMKPIPFIPFQNLPVEVE